MRSSFIILLIFLSMAASAQVQDSLAQTQNCESVDLSNELGPVRDQGDMGFCFANAAADLLSFRFRQEWGGYQASAIFIGLLYSFQQASDKPQSSILSDNGGDVRVALNYTAELDYACPRELDSLFMNGGPQTSLKQKLNSAKVLKELFDARTQSKDANLKYQNFVQDLKNKNSIIALISEENLETVLKLNLNNAVFELAKASCQAFKLPMTLNKGKIRRFYSDDADYFDESLNRRVKNSPDLLMLINRQLDKDNVAIINFPTNLIGANSNDIDEHSAVLVGRRFINGQCHYKIRNSWGPDCDYVQNKKIHSYYNSKVKCEPGGHVWVSGSLLRPALSYTGYIVR